MGLEGQNQGCSAGRDGHRLTDTQPAGERPFELADGCPLGELAAFQDEQDGLLLLFADDRSCDGYQEATSAPSKR